jgi:hypothetical protein
MSNETRNEKQKTYSVEMVCLNCSCRRRMEFPLGSEVPRRVDCPNCGCCQMMRMLTSNSHTAGGWSSNLAECMDVFFNGRSAK